jgi:3-oxoadipate enol-lactonase
VPVVSTENASIDYDVRGAGPALVLINGLGFGRWGFFKQVPSLSRHFATITFDARSERDPEGVVAGLAGDVADLLGHLRINRAHVLGASLGGLVAQRLALSRPDLVARLVLVSTGHGGRGSERMSLGAMGKMFGFGALSLRKAARRGLEGRPPSATVPRTPMSSIVSSRSASPTPPRWPPTTGRRGLARASTPRARSGA